ncbi:hypothetical protein X975_00652, partial [Stegodyphus mimosarum]
MIWKNTGMNFLITVTFIRLIFTINMSITNKRIGNTLILRYTKMFTVCASH